MQSFLQCRDSGPFSYSNIDLRFELVPKDRIPAIGDIRYHDAHRFFVGEGENSATFFRSFPGCEPYAYVSRKSIREGVLVCQYLSGNEQFMNYAHNLMTLMDIEATLLAFDALILHASFISWQGKGVLFSAPSGTGKSTQADLWRQYEEADILNGDRAALRRVSGRWRAYGLPYAGTSGIYRNESVPLKAITALRQSGENRIRRIYGAEAFKYLYPETMIHRWDTSFEQKASKLLFEVLTDVPVYLLECRPDQEAVQLLKNELSKDTNK